MATTRSPNHSSDEGADPTPFLGTSSDESTSGRRLLRRPSLREAARFLRQASGRRLMREPSMVVREAAAEQLEERQSDWAYSKPVVVLDILWNFAFVAAAVTVLILGRNENPNMPLRLWIVGYAMQCVLHVGCVCVEYRRRQRRREQTSPAVAVGGSGDLSSASMEGSRHYVSLPQLEDGGISMAKHLESANTMFSFIWWVVGFYWISADSEALVQNSPLLYWLCIAFLGFDVFFVVFCIALACIIGIAVCCCLPCIIALLYAVADQEGASKEDIEQLSKFKFQRTETNEKLAGNTQGAAGGIMTECDTDSPIEHVLSDEDASRLFNTFPDWRKHFVFILVCIAFHLLLFGIAFQSNFTLEGNLTKWFQKMGDNFDEECCICLSAYDDGVELRQLPCGHHFHCSCVDKWLHINATCPLCKYNILKSTSHGQDEV